MSFPIVDDLSCPIMPDCCCTRLTIAAFLCGGAVSLLCLLFFVVIPVPYAALLYGVSQFVVWCFVAYIIDYLRRREIVYNLLEYSDDEEWENTID